MVRSILASRLPPEIELQLARQLTAMQRQALAENVFKHYLSVRPDDARVWLELAANRVGRGHINPALDAIETAVEKGGDTIRAELPNDKRLQKLFAHPRFRALLPVVPKKQTIVPLNKYF
jgi:hypothetical protein